MTYIKKEDVQKILESKYIEWYGTICNEINSLPTINPEEIISEKLEFCKWQAQDSERHFWWMVVCEQLLQRFKS